MTTDIISNLSPLDELIQLIYQSIHQFVVMSSVTHDKWTVHVGMVGAAGRWWRGVWEEKNVVNVIVSLPLIFSIKLFAFVNFGEGWEEHGVTRSVVWRGFG